MNKYFTTHSPIFLIVPFTVFFLVSCNNSSIDTSNNTHVNKGLNNTKTPIEFGIAYEKIILDNGLEVIFHVDKSDPVVAVTLMAHVGSAREKVGRTGPS